MTSAAHLAELRALCQTHYVPGDAQYAEKSSPWSVWADRHPKLVVEPQDLETMQHVVRFLSSSNLDFCVRNSGTGGASADDVCLSTKGMNQFHFDRQSETVIVGAGYDWGDVDRLMEENTDDYVCVGTRCSWVGVTGSALVGGLSWLSHEFGLISDPQNLLDVQIVLRDGRILWASEEPDLLWALRGGGGNFGGVAMMHRRKADPKVAMHVVNQGPGMGSPDQGPRPGIAVLMYDAHGEVHARSDDGFAWAFRLPGAVELGTGEHTLREIHAIAETFRNYQGRNMFWLSAPLIEHVDNETLVKAWKWYEDSLSLHPGFGAGSTVLLEFMQEGAFNSSVSRASTAWPHSGRRHVMQFVLGCAPEDAPHGVREIAMQQFAKAERQIAGDQATGEYHAGFLHEFNDLGTVYGENYKKLKTIKALYDPDNCFNKGVDLASNDVTPDMIV